MRVTPSNTYLVEILITMAFMPIDMYIQEATKSHGNRFYVTYGRSSAGIGRSISEKSVKVLASGITYWED